MRDKIEKANLVLRGKESLNDGIRFRIFASSLAGVHLILAGIAAVLRCQPLLVANVIVCLLDLLSNLGTRNGRNYFTWISIVYFASCFQSLYACVLLGYQSYSILCI